MAVSANDIIGATEGLALAFGVGGGVWYSSGSIPKSSGSSARIEVRKTLASGGIRHRGGVWGWGILGRVGLEENQIMDSTFFWLGACLLVWFLVWLHHDFSHQIVLIHCG